jgi:hypothetical protein
MTNQVTGQKAKGPADQSMVEGIARGKGRTGVCSEGNSRSEKRGGRTIGHTGV